MKSTLIIMQVLIIAAASANGSMVARRSANKSVALKQINVGGASFAMDLFKTIYEEKDGNLIFSPLSVQLALALLYPATGGDSAALLVDRLRLPTVTNDELLIGFSDFMAMLKDPALKIANRIFVDETVVVKKGYMQNVEKYLHAGAQTVSFKKELTKSISLINSWVEQVTNNNIKDLLHPDSLDASTKVVLVNAIHFKAKWKTQFKKSYTLNKPFHVSKSKQVKVKMMTIDEHFDFHHDKNLEAKIISMPFKGDRFKMYVVLPDEVDGLDNVVKRIYDGESWDQNALRSEFLRLSLPKYKVEMEISLNEVFAKNGLGSLFTPAADLSGLSDTGRLSVSKMVQKAVIDVDEDGVEAAAATDVELLVRSINIEPSVEFKADHPFLFIIKAVVPINEVQLFVGTYYGPNSEYIVGRTNK